MHSPISSTWRLLILGFSIIAGSYLRFDSAISTTIDHPVRADAAQYTAYAFNLKAYGVYSHDFGVLRNTGVKPGPDAQRSPGYPFFLLPFTYQPNLERFYRLVVFTQVLLSILVIPLSYWLTRKTLGDIGGLAVAVLTAFSPHLVVANSYLLTETLFSLLLVLGLCLASSRPETAHSSRWLLAGLILAVAALVRPTLQYFVVFLAIFLLLERSRSAGWRATIYTSLPFLGVFSVWLLRNWFSLHTLSDPTLTINTLYQGMYPDFMYEGRKETFGFPYRFDPNASSIGASLDNTLAAIAHRFESRPWEHIVWYLSKPLYLFQWDIISGQGDAFVYPATYSPYYDKPLFAWSHDIMKWLHPLLIWSSFAGAMAAWLPRHSLRLTESQWFTARLLSLTYLYFIFVHIAGSPFPRYAVPIRPLSYGLGLLTPYLIYLQLLPRRTARVVRVGRNKRSDCAG